MTNEPLDRAGQLSDKSEFLNEEVGTLVARVPINRNLSIELFGQLQYLVEEDI